MDLATVDDNPDDPHNLYRRFVIHQVNLFESALAEVRRGKKDMDWQWYFLPTGPRYVNGVEKSSEATRYFALRSDEAVGAYLQLPPKKIPLDGNGQITEEGKGVTIATVDLRANYLTMTQEILSQLQGGNTLREMFGLMVGPKVKASIVLFHRVAAELIEDQEIASVCGEILEFDHDFTALNCKSDKVFSDSYTHYDACFDACVEGNETLIAEMLKLDDVRAKINDVEKIKWANGTLLYHAMEHGRWNFIPMLIENGADPNILCSQNRTALFPAIERGYRKCVKSLLDFGANANMKASNGETPLTTATKKGSKDLVEVLLEYNADPLVGDENGNTALHSVAYILYDGVADILLEKGASPNAPNKLGETPLYVVLSKRKQQVKSQSAARSQERIAKALMDHGADLHFADMRGTTPLDLIVEKNCISVMEYVIKNKSRYENSETMHTMKEEWNRLDENGRTLLHKACQEDNYSLVLAMLYLVGADPNLIDNDGHTPLFYATEKGFCAIMNILIENGANVDKTDERIFHEEKRRKNFVVQPARYSFDDGRTPLFMACQNGQRDAVLLLLNNGADPYLVNKDSLLPADVASGRHDIQQLLRIRDYFDRKAQGENFEEKYYVCGLSQVGLLSTSKKNKPKAPKLEDIIHDMVRYPEYKDSFRKIFLANPDICDWKDTEGRTVRQVACQACRSVTLFMGRYQLEETPKYESATCQVFFAQDWGDVEGGERTEATPVAMKFIMQKEHFESEVYVRRTEDDKPRFSGDFVTNDLAYYSSEKNADYANACSTWSNVGRYVIPDFCIVLEQGDRSLLEVMSAENISSKALEVRTVLHRLCETLLHVHEKGFVHGDVKPRNFLRHSGTSNVWKLIDFDACVRAGEKIGLKVSTGYIPPEMIKVAEKETEDGEREQIFELLSPNAGSDSEDFAVATESFDVWSFGMTMYHLVTGQSFFHCDGRENLVDLTNLANVTDSLIQRRLNVVEDVNARVLLSSILRVDPQQRLSMRSIWKDIYFNPSKMPQGRQAKSLGKRQSRILTETASPSNASPRISISLEDQGSDDFERYISSISNISFFGFKDQDVDWNDKLLRSEIEAFDFYGVRPIGTKPKLIDSDTIYQNPFLRSFLLDSGPDFFMGCLVDYFELYQIMDEAEHICETIKATLVRDVKSLKGIFVKLFVRGKGLNDVVRGTLFCDSLRNFEFVAQHLQEKYDVYLKPPKDEAGAWPIPKLLVSSKNRSIGGKCLTVEIQFSTVYFHIASKVSNDHLVYEFLRESTGYLEEKKKEPGYRDFLDRLNSEYFDTEGFFKEEQNVLGYFEGLSVEASGNDAAVAKGFPTGLILSGLVSCRCRKFFFLAPKGYMEMLSPSSFVVDNSLTLLSYHSYWSEESYELEGKVVEFKISFKDRGTIVAGVGTKPCLHGTEDGDGDGDHRCSASISRSSFVVRWNGKNLQSKKKLLPDQKEAKLRFQASAGVMEITFTPCSGSMASDGETIDIKIPTNQQYHLYMRASPGVHDVKYHSVDIL